jgi:uncharacterized protein YbbK (DUF523 family)/uncharacterized protein YbgA (DUF1722 family)
MPPPEVSVEHAREPIRIGVSACLLGQKVRYDGGHKRDAYLTGTLAPFVEWVPVCPEIEVGMGAPREPIQLVKRGGSIRLLGTRTGADHTGAMRAYARRRVERLAAEGLSGFVLKSNSPSCGLERVRVRSGAGRVTRTGRGLFAAAVALRFPTLPIEEEGRLLNPRLRENWIERVFAYHRLQRVWAGRWRIADLVEFHAAHRLVLLAHSPGTSRSLDRLLSGAPPLDRQALRARYERGFMAALARPATRGRHAKVLLHALGHFGDRIDGASRRRLLERIRDYRHGRAPLVVPLTLVSHRVRVLGIDSLKGQIYLRPHPHELALLKEAR